MDILFGVGDEAVAPVAEHLRRALNGFPTVGRVQHHQDDVCFLAAGSTRDAPRERRALERRRETCLLFDGWLANRDEICRALDLPSGPSAPKQDAEIVAAALERWGGEALGRLHGDFTIAWWKQAERRLLLACDRTGGRPLFYHASGSRLVFSSLVSAIFLHPHIDRILNPAMLAASAAPLFKVEDTCFEGVKQLLPCFRLDWSPTCGVQVSPYWQMDLSRRIRLRRDGDYVEAARDLLDTVVGEACRTQEPLAAMLSGGLDSTAVAATAARLTAPDRLHTLTLRPNPALPLPPCGRRTFQDEWGHAQAVARMHPSITPHVVEPDMEGLEENLRSGFYWMGRPPVHLLAPLWMRGAWRRARQLGASVVLVGSSGNGTLSATALPIALRPALKEWPQALHAAALAGSVGRPVLPFLRALRPEWVRDIRDRLASRPVHGRTRSALTPESAARFATGRGWDAFFTGDGGASLGRRARLRTVRNTWLGRSTVAGLRFRDGIHRRDPLGDVRLAEFCLAIPSRQFTRLGADRHLARRVLADRLPPLVVNERRIGRQNAEWFAWATHHRAWMAAELEGIEASTLGRELIDIPRLRGILDAWPADSAAAEPRYHEVMSVLAQGVALGGFITWAEGRNR